MFSISFRKLLDKERGNNFFTLIRPSDRVRKKMENYAEIFGNIMRTKVMIMWKRRQIMRKFLKLIKLVPWHFLMYKIHFNVLPRSLVLYEIFGLLLPFMNRYFFVQRFFVEFLRSLNGTRKTGHRKSQTRTQTHQKRTHGTPGGLLKIDYEWKGVFSSLFWVNNFLKMINPFAIFASEDVQQLLSCLYVAIF